MRIADAPFAVQVKKENKDFAPIGVLPLLQALPKNHELVSPI